jgi:hypothetical protein
MVSNNTLAQGQGLTTNIKKSFDLIKCRIIRKCTIFVHYQNFLDI